MTYDKNNITAEQIRRFLIDAFEANPAGVLIEGITNNDGDTITVTIRKAR